MAKLYESVTQEELILRDKLALDRTILANERTFLSYLRTTLAIVVVGVTMLHLSQDVWIDTLGGVAILLGVGILLVGIYRTLTMSRAIRVKGQKP